MIRSFSLAFLLCILALPAKVDKLSFYRAFQSESQEKMETKLNSMKNWNPSTLRDAYIGALTMKQSQFMKTPKEKAGIFKEGKELLEKAIAKQPKNGEFRFLRLAIQENSPKILKYNGQLEEDEKIIVETFSSMDATLKKVIREYAKQSEKLSSSKLK